MTMPLLPGPRYVPQYQMRYASLELHSILFSAKQVIDCWFGSHSISNRGPASSVGSATDLSMQELATVAVAAAITRIHKARRRKAISLSRFHMAEH